MKTAPPESTATQTVPASSSGLGTFGGVFTPSILTVLGVIMYLRLGWVVGNVGLLGTLMIVTLSTAITLLTALSICAIATDRVVRVGGAYYMIGRSLGIEIGGAVGIPLYFAQALSVALYTIGFAESVVSSFGNLNQLYVALITTVAVAILALTSAKLAIKAQYFIMVAIVLSLLALIFGKPVEPTQIEMWGSSSGEPFWVVFAVFFPAVTGIMAGVNMSGDLKDPIRSIPTGTLAAVGTGYAVYMLLPILLASRASAATLIDNPLIMQQMAVWGPAILLGVWGATLSSAIGSLLGAPRISQALARDRVLPSWLNWLGRGSGEDDEPRLGTIFTLGVVIAAVFIGKLDLIAPVLSMFFLTTYLVLNVAAGIEGFLNSPSFRPAFRVHWSLSLLGAIGCLAVMFLINPVATVLAAIVVLIIYFWLQRRQMETTWGDARRGMWMTLMRTGILEVDREEDPKNWRPNILILSGAPTKRWNLIELADSFTQNRGLITVSNILPVGSRSVRQQFQMEGTIRKYIEKKGVKALVRLVTAPNLFEGGSKLLETYGIGPWVPNTFVLGASSNPAKREAYCELITKIHQSQRNVIILQENDRLGFGSRRQVDVWWGGLNNNGGLMLLLAHLLSSDVDWDKAQINLKLVVDEEEAASQAYENVNDLVEELRFEIEVKVIVGNGRTFLQILREESRKTDLIFLGLPEPKETFVEDYERLISWTEGLHTTVLVLAAADYDYEEVLAEDI